MGIKTCRRLQCINIMCDTYIPNIGYICDECKISFKYYYVNSNLRLLKCLTEFMQIGKLSEEDILMQEVEEFFNMYTN